MRELLPRLVGALVVCLFFGCDDEPARVDYATWQCSAEMTRDGSPLDFSDVLPDRWWPRDVCIWHSGLAETERLPARFDEGGRLAGFEMPAGDYILRLWVLDPSTAHLAGCGAGAAVELGWPVDDPADMDRPPERIEGADQARCGISPCCRAALCGQYLVQGTAEGLTRSVVSLFRPCADDGCRAGSSGPGDGPLCDTWAPAQRCVPGDTVACPLDPVVPGCRFAAPLDEMACEGGAWPGCRVPPEVCDGADQDCDGSVDEGFDLATDVAHCGACGVRCALENAEPTCDRGACAIRACVRGFRDNDGAPGNGCEYACQPGDAHDEVCNGIDDDCDGQVDEEVPGVGEACTEGIGECESAGHKICRPRRIAGVQAGQGAQLLACDATPRPPAVEACNGLDDDCNGRLDDLPQLGEACFEGVGACRRLGQWACDAEPGAGAEKPVRCTAEPGEPIEELCNGIDDDCDGMTDEGEPEVGERCRLQDGETPDIHGRCRQGLTLCVGGEKVCDHYEATVEVCDDIDWDCDGATDNSFDVGADCTVGVGSCANPGQRACTDEGISACNVSPGAPGVERCNGADDDCDGETDEDWPSLGFQCHMGQGACSRPGRWVCSLGGEIAVCNAQPAQPSRELCNGVDDDCDGTVDEGADLQCGQDTGACVAGVQVCDDGLLGACQGAVGPAGEACNGLDDDCDGTVDEGMTRVCGTDEGWCRTGMETCRVGGVAPGVGEWGACVGSRGQRAERCNDEDDDCDGRTDEDVTRSCGSDTGACVAGTQVCAGGDWGACEGRTWPVAEVCNGADDDCDGNSDEHLWEPCGSDTGECRPGVSRCRNGSFDQCDNPIPPSPETCDGRDNDCDGETDENLGGRPCIEEDGDGWRCGVTQCNGGRGTCDLSGNLVLDAVVHDLLAECGRLLQQANADAMDGGQ